MELVEIGAGGGESDVAVGRAKIAVSIIGRSNTL
jgi:hypothetical protein